MLAKNTDPPWVSEKRAGAAAVKSGSFASALDNYLGALRLLQHSNSSQKAKDGHPSIGIEIAKLYCNLSFCYSKLGKPDFALESANEAVRMVGSLRELAGTILAKAHARRGMALQELKRHEEAVHAFSCAVESATVNNDITEYSRLLELSKLDLVHTVTETASTSGPLTSDAISQAAPNQFADNCYLWCLPYMSTPTLVRLTTCASCFRDAQMNLTRRMLKASRLKEVLSVAPFVRTDERTLAKVTQALHAIDDYVNKNISFDILIPLLWEALLSTPRFSDASRLPFAQAMVNICMQSHEECDAYSSALVKVICMATSGTRDERRMVQSLMVAMLDMGASRSSSALVHYSHLLQAAISCTHPGDIGKCAAEGISEILFNFTVNGYSELADGAIRPRTFMTHLFASGLVYTLMRFVSYTEHRFRSVHEGEQEWICELMGAARVFFFDEAPAPSDEEEEEKELKTEAREGKTFVEIAGHYSIHLFACQLVPPRDGQRLAKDTCDRIRTGFNGLRSWLIDAEADDRLDGAFLLFLLRLNVARYRALGNVFSAKRDVRTEVLYLTHEIRRKGGPYPLLRWLEHDDGILGYIQGLQAMQQILGNCLLQLEGLEGYRCD